MTNAMPPLQMMIKLSYGWRPLPLPQSPCFCLAYWERCLPLDKGRCPEGAEGSKNMQPEG